MFSHINQQRVTIQQNHMQVEYIVISLCSNTNHTTITTNNTHLNSQFSPTSLTIQQNHMQAEYIVISLCSNTNHSTISIH